MTKLILPILLVLLLVSACSTANRHFWEIPATDADYIAFIRQHPDYGTAVYYNTHYCETIGADACGFFRAQAHAHSELNHQILPSADYPEGQIAAADCWAARNSNPAEVRAAYNFLAGQNRDPGIPIIGDPNERAETIRTCARAANKWIGEPA